MALGSRPVLLFVLGLGCVQAGEFVIDVSDYMQDCENGKAPPSVNLDDFESLEDENGAPLMNGKMVFEQAYNDPTELKIYSERFKQGTWTSGEISRDVLNVCPLLLAASEPWYTLTSMMKKQDCPFEAGHVENFDMVLLGNMGLTIPETFAGDWRLYVEVTTQRGAEKVTECVRMAFEIKEI